MSRAPHKVEPLDVTDPCRRYGYTHRVRTASGYSVGLHKSEDDAKRSAADADKAKVESYL